jgi:hypothetical protein
MKVRSIAPQDDHTYTAGIFHTIGRTPEEITKECNRLLVNPVDGRYFVCTGEDEVMKEIFDDQWIVSWTHTDARRIRKIYTQWEFWENFDYVRDMTCWDPGHRLGLINQAMHLVNESRETRATKQVNGNTVITVHPMAWGLFYGGAVREYMRDKRLKEWAPELGRKWEKCPKCVLGNIRFTEADYEKARKEDLFWAKAREEKGEPAEDPEFWTHTKCNSCGGVGFIHDKWMSAQTIPKDHTIVQVGFTDGETAQLSFAPDAEINENITKWRPNVAYE